MDLDNLFLAEIYKYILRLRFKFIHIYADLIKNIIFSFIYWHIDVIIRKSAL